MELSPVRENYQEIKVSPLYGHYESIYSVAYSPNGQIIASGSADQLIRIWNVETGENIEVFKGHGDEINSVAYSPQTGNFIASGSHDSTVRIWNIEKNKESMKLEGHGDIVLSVAYSPDEQFLASGSADRTIRIWNVKTGQESMKIEGHPDAITSVAYSPVLQDGKQFIASGSYDNTIRIWNVENGQESMKIEGHTKSVMSVAYSPNGKFISSGSEDKTIRIWDVKNGQQIILLEGHTGTVFSVAYSPNGKFIASGSADNSIRIWDIEIENGQQIMLLEVHTGTVFSVAYSPNGKFIASGSDDRTMRIFDINPSQEIDKLKVNKNTVPLFHIEDVPNIGAIGMNAHKGTITSTAYSSDGQFIAAGTKMNIIIWDAGSGKEIKSLPVKNGFNLAFSPDGKYIASGILDNTVRIWDVKTGQQNRVLEGHTDSVMSVAYSPNGEFIASGSYDMTIRIWDTKSGNKIRVLDKHRAGVLSVIYSPDGLFIASGSADSTVRIWDAKYGYQLKILDRHVDEVTIVKYSPDGKFIASGSVDGYIRIWNTEDGELIRTLLNNGIVTSLAYSPDGKIIASTADEDIYMWNAKNGEQILRIFSDDNMSNVIFSRNGDMAFGVGAYVYLNIWKVDTLKNISFVEEDLNVLRVDYLGNVYKFQNNEQREKIIEFFKEEILAIARINNNIIIQSAYALHLFIEVNSVYTYTSNVPIKTIPGLFEVYDDKIWVIRDNTIVTFTSDLTMEDRISTQVTDVGYLSINTNYIRNGKKFKIIIVASANKLQALIDPITRTSIILENISISNAALMDKKIITISGQWINVYNIKNRNIELLYTKDLYSRLKKPFSMIITNQGSMIITNQGFVVYIGRGGDYAIDEVETGTEISRGKMSLRGFESKNDFQLLVQENKFRIIALDIKQNRSLPTYAKIFTMSTFKRFDKAIRSGHKFNATTFLLTANGVYETVSNKVLQSAYRAFGIEENIADPWRSILELLGTIYILQAKSYDGRLIRTLIGETLQVRTAYNNYIKGQCYQEDDFATFDKLNLQPNNVIRLVILENGEDISNKVNTDSKIHCMLKSSLKQIIKSKRGNTDYGRIGGKYVFNISTDFGVFPLYMESFENVNKIVRDRGNRDFYLQQLETINGKTVYTFNAIPLEVVKILEYDGLQGRLLEFIQDRIIYLQKHNEDVLQIFNEYPLIRLLQKINLKEILLVVAEQQDTEQQDIINAINVAVPREITRDFINELYEITYNNLPFETESFLIYEHLIGSLLTTYPNTLTMLLKTLQSRMGDIYQQNPTLIKNPNINYITIAKGISLASGEWDILAIIQNDSTLVGYQMLTILIALLLHENDVSRIDKLIRYYQEYFNKQYSIALACQFLENIHVAAVESRGFRDVRSLAVANSILHNSVSTLRTGISDADQEVLITKCILYALRNLAFIEKDIDFLLDENNAGQITEKVLILLKREPTLMVYIEGKASENLKDNLKRKFGEL